MIQVRILAGQLRVALLLAALLLALPALVPSAARPALPEAGLAAQEPSDSVAVHREARRAQARFERIRRRHLPVALGSGGGSCDEPIGRFCFRHTPGYRWRPPPEAPGVVRARNELLARLEEAARRIPGDRWILGQRVRYLTEHGAWDAALALASDPCRVRPRTPCDELRGLVLHHLGRYEEAEEVFRAADTARHPDPGPLVDERTRRRLREERAGGADLALFWWLSDPLHLVPGNDRLTEHHARRAQAALRADAATPWSLPWGEELTEITLRYGTEIGWQRAPPEPLRGRDVGIVGHQHPDARQFVPPPSVLDDPWRLEPGAWSLESERPRSAWAPPYAREVRPATSTLYVLREADSIVVLARIRHGPPPSDTALVGGDPEGRLLGVPPDSLLPWHGEPERVGLFLRGEDGSEHATRRRTASGDALLLRVPAGRYVVSLERWDPAAALASRDRRGLVEPAHPPDRAVLSDLLVLEPAPTEPTSPEALLDRLRPPGPLRTGETVSLAWRLQGLGWRGEERIGYRLSLEPADRGRLRRAAEWLGIVEPDPGLSLEWSETGPARPGPVLRSVDIRIPALEAGSYRLRLRVELPGRTPVRVERDVRVVEAGGPP